MLVVGIHAASRDLLRPWLMPAWLLIFEDVTDVDMQLLYSTSLTADTMSFKDSISPSGDVLLRR